MAAHMYMMNNDMFEDTLVDLDLSGVSMSFVRFAQFRKLKNQNYRY